MSALVWVISSLLLVFAIAIIAVVLLQEGHEANLSGAIAGGADSFLSKGKARTLDAFLAKWTKFIAIAFFILAFVADIVLFISNRG